MRREHDNLNELNENKMELNPRYTFDSFVVSDSQLVAFEACLEVADASANSKCNPLFLYGDTGLGKTHLMQAVANHIIKKNPDMKVLYVSSETFTNDVINSIRKNKREELRDKYHSLDVLLIDDIQFLIGKDATMEEFINALNALYISDKQIIISANKPPKELEIPVERMRSKLEYGGCFEVQAPDYETRMVILKLTAEKEHIVGISEEVYSYIASNITDDIRRMLGALHKVSFYSKVEDHEMTLEEVAFVLKDLIN